MSDLEILALIMNHSRAQNWAKRFATDPIQHDHEAHDHLSIETRLDHQAEDIICQNNTAVPHPLPSYPGHKLATRATNAAVSPLKGALDCKVGCSASGPAGGASSQEHLRLSLGPVEEMPGASPY